MEETIQQQASAWLTRERAHLATVIVAFHYHLHPEVWEKFGPAGREKSLRDEEFHLSYLAEALTTNDPMLFLEYVQWCKVLFANLRFNNEQILGFFTTMRDVLVRELPATLVPPVTEYLDLGIAHLARIPATLPTFLPAEAPLAEIAGPYLQALLLGRRAEASELILSAVEGGVSVKDIYLQVFQPTQREIGRLWQTNQISVAQEHYCTAATQMIMSQLYPYLFSSRKHGRTLIATCVGGELHEIGARMVADFFELDGWDTYYLGANTPAESICRAIDDRQADMLAISATLTPHVHAVTDLLRRVHDALGTRVKILVGGYPFNVMPTLWQLVGADGYAPDALSAVTVGNRLAGLPAS